MSLLFTKERPLGPIFHLFGGFMLEESCNTMDKKNNRQLPVAQKPGNGNDAKRLQNNGEQQRIRHASSVCTP